MEHFYHNIQGWFTYPNLYSEMVNRALVPAHFVEVGVWKGTSAAYMAVEIANSGKTIKFDCIDTWEGSEEHLDPASSAFELNLLTNQDWLYDTFITNMKPVQEWYTPYRMESLQAVKLYQPASLDFVFIDAAHDYQSVLADIQAWFPKVKGSIAGHDYSWSEEVKQAVHDFFDPLGLEVRETEGCWVVYKS
jgi:cephalosporin hydroxylase